MKNSNSSSKIKLLFSLRRSDGISSINHAKLTLQAQSHTNKNNNELPK